MTWLDQLEKKFGRKAIPNISKFFIIAYTIGTLLYLGFGNTFYSLVGFSVPGILAGQIWRLVTWILIPNSGFSIFSLLFIFCLWMFGKSMENFLGSFRMNVYFFMGILVYIIGGFIAYLAFHVTVQLSMYYILFSMYLMLGLFMPEAEVRLNFVLPVKMKWFNIFYFIILAVNVITYFSYGVEAGIAYGTEIVLALANVFYFTYVCKRRVSIKHKKRQREFHSQFKAATPRPGSGIGFHKCTICGRDSEQFPDLTFRYCSKCNGGYEYCEDHLFTHNHIQ